MCYFSKVALISNSIDIIDSFKCFFLFWSYSLSCKYLFHGSSRLARFYEVSVAKANECLCAAKASTMEVYTEVTICKTNDVLYVANLRLNISIVRKLSLKGIQYFRNSLT